ncbi:MAG: LPS assembly protein LptD [Mariprofundales bacterium]
MNTNKYKLIRYAHKYLLVFLLLFIANINVTIAADMDLSAITVQHDAYGQVIANGDVELRYKGQTLYSDQLTYNPATQSVYAAGKILLKSADKQLEAASGTLYFDKHQGILYDAHLTLATGEHLQAATLEQISDGIYVARKASFSACPPESNGWLLSAEKMVMDKPAGELRANHSKFAFLGMPLIYAPYWVQPLGRRSGVMVPHIAGSKRRGTEIELPLYWAVSQAQDITLTPRHMTARGTMPQLEWRYRGENIISDIDGSWFNDNLLERQRGFIRGDIQWNINNNTFLTIKAHHIGDRYYLADFSKDSDESASRFLFSQALLGWHNDWSRWQMRLQHQQNLVANNNKRTLQLLPQIDGELHSEILDKSIQVGLRQQITAFSRKTDVDGWRLVLRPYAESPMSFFGGGLRMRSGVGMRNHQYWLANIPNNLIKKTQTRYSITTFDAFTEARLVLERVNEAKTWRHSIEPILRFDWAISPDQATLPNFDSAFGRLSMTNLLSANRFSGYDRIERVQRISLLLSNRIETKDKNDMKHAIAARTWLLAKAGIAYDMLRLPIDNKLQQTADRPYSNLLGEITLSPWNFINIKASGQYDPAKHYWTTSRANITGLYDKYKASLQYQHTDSRFAAPGTELLQWRFSTMLSSRWQMQAAWDFDATLHRTQQASGQIHYAHSCWDLLIERYMLHRPTGSGTSTDYGWRFLLGFTGLGSVGA